MARSTLYFSVPSARARPSYVRRASNMKNGQQNGQSENIMEEVPEPVNKRAVAPAGKRCQCIFLVSILVT